MADESTYWPDYDPKASPGEEPGKYRVEQGVASYKVAPPPARRAGKKSGPRK